MLMVALLLTVVSTGAFAREFPAADAENEDYPTVQALRYMGGPVEKRSGGRHHVRALHSRRLGEEKVEQTWARAENNRPSFVTTDHYKFAGYDTPTEHTMSPEVFVMPQKAWSSLSTEDQKIFHEAAMTGLYASAQRDPAVAELIERIREVD